MELRSSSSHSPGSIPDSSILQRLRSSSTRLQSTVVVKTHLFPLMKISNDHLIAVFNKLKPQAYCRLNKAARTVQKFVNEHHWRIGIRVDGNLRFWVSYPRGTNRCVNVELLIDSFDKSYKVVPLFKALSTFSGFTFPSVDLSFLGMYDKKFTPTQRELLIQFFENRIWRECKIIADKEENLLMKYVTIVKPPSVTLNALPKKTLPGYVRKLEIDALDTEKILETLPKWPSLYHLKVNSTFKHDEIHLFFENMVRLWKTKKLGNLILIQANLDLTFEAFDVRSARMELWARETFKEMYYLLKHKFFLYPDIQARSSGSTNKKDYLGTINLLMSCDGSRKLASLMIHFAASKEENRQCCADTMTFCSDMDCIKFDETYRPFILPGN